MSTTWSDPGIALIDQIAIVAWSAMINRLARGTIPPRDPADPKRACDLSITCPTCQISMRPEHAHYRCPQCGYRDSCCF
jgi:hypothetical protein